MTKKRTPDTCAFCRILNGETEAFRVFEDDISVAFLDYRPLARGHCLLVPRRHCDSLLDLPAEAAGPILQNAQILVRALEKGLKADGAFLAINVKVSQSVPHLHFHLVPRWNKDGLFARPFLWMRKPQSQASLGEVQAAIRAALVDLLVVDLRAFPGPSNSHP